MRTAPAFALLSALALAVPVHAAEPAPADPHADHAKPAKPAKAEKICRDLGTRTGTRVGGGRRCKTAEEWARIDGTAPPANTDVRGIGTISRTNR